LLADLVVGGQRELEGEAALGVFSQQVEAAVLGLLGGVGAMVHPADDAGDGDEEARAGVAGVGAGQVFVGVLLPLGSE